MLSFECYIVILCIAFIYPTSNLKEENPGNNRSDAQHKRDMDIHDRIQWSATRLMKGLEHEERLRGLGLFSPEKGRLRWGFINAFKYLKGGCKDNRSRFFSVVISARTGGNGPNLKHRRFPQNTRKSITHHVRVTKHWHNLPWEVVESPSLDICKSHLDVVLGNQL